MNETISWKALRNGLIASAFCWAFIIGMGWLCYRIGQLF